MKPATVAISLLLTGLVQDAAKPEIGWNLKPGEKVRYEIERTVLMHAKEETVEMRMLFGMVLEPGPRDDSGIAPVKFTIDRVVMTGKDSKIDETYDSDRHKADAAKNPAFKLMAACTNGTFSARISKEGSISEVSGLTEFLQKAAGDIPELKDGDQQTAPRFAKYFEEHLREGLGVAPGKHVAKGDTWETQLSTLQQVVGRATLKIKSTLKEVRGDEAVLDRELTFDFSGDPSAAGAKGSGKGEAIWSTSQGRLISGRWSAHVVTSRGESNVTWQIKLATREKK